MTELSDIELGVLPKIGPEHRLTRVWGRTVALGWTLIAVALITVGASSQVIGRPMIWIDDQRFGAVALIMLVVATFAPMIILVTWSLLAGPWVPFLSLLVTGELILLAALDRHNSPGGALVTIFLAIAALLLSVASFAGRYRLSEVDSSIITSN
ncbi:MAG: hypothetical protein WCG40_07745 [Actinomycetes bacterium]